HPMQVRIRRRPVFGPTLVQFFLVLGLLGTLGWSMVYADIIIMKDGYTLRGTLKRDTTVIIDPESKQPVAMPKETGFFRIDDGARKISFSHLLVQEVSEADRAQQREVEQFQNRFTRLDNFRVPSGLFAGFTSWNAKWDRTVKLRTGEGMVN